MKHLYVVLICVATIISACVSKKKADQLAADNSSLSLEVQQKDSIINDVFSSLNMLSENLDAIKERENIVTAQSSGELNPEIKNKIQSDIEEIDKLLITNRETITRLKDASERLHKANIKIAKLDKLVKTLTAQVEAKDGEINDLKTKLSGMNIQIADLNTKVDSLNSHVAGLASQKNELENTVSSQGQQLTTAYYIVGDESELLKNNVVAKSGFVKKALKINSGYNLDYFTKINIGAVKEILVGHKRATIVSSHPDGSYKLEQNSNGVLQKIIITDKDRFWESSKILVVSYK